MRWWCFKVRIGRFFYLTIDNGCYFNLLHEPLNLYSNIRFIFKYGYITTKMMPLSGSFYSRLTIQRKNKFTFVATNYTLDYEMYRFKFSIDF